MGGLTGAGRGKFWAALYREIRRLPPRYRTPVVLCGLERRSLDAAARQLRWPVETVKRRLARAHARLRSRLARRGLAVPDSRHLAGLLRDAALAVPPRLIDAVVRAAVRSPVRGPGFSPPRDRPGCQARTRAGTAAPTDPAPPSKASP